MIVSSENWQSVFNLWYCSVKPHHPQPWAGEAGEIKEGFFSGVPSPTSGVKDPPSAAVQLPAYQDPSEGLSVSIRQTAAAGTEVCWESVSHDLAVRTRQAQFEKHMGKGRDVWKVLGTPSFPLTALSLSQRYGHLILSQTWSDVLCNSKSQIC